MQYDIFHIPVRVIWSLGAIEFSEDLSLNHNAVNRSFQGSRSVKVCPPQWSSLF